MNAQAEHQTTLSNVNIWIIDDDIPIQAASFEKDDLVSGIRPIDRGALLSLLTLEDENWTDRAVLELCKELINNKVDIKAFLLPTGPIEHLKNGAKAPDVMVFDMNYVNIKDKNVVLTHLETILKSCISVIQIYSKELPEQIMPDLDPLIKKYPTRLQLPQLKTNITPRGLEDLIAKKLEKSLSVQLAANVRRLSTIAIESVLVEIDNLPVDVALKLLSGKEDTIQDLEFVELLSVKVGDYLKSSDDIAAAIKQYGQKLGVTIDKEKQFVDETIDLFATVVRNNIQYDKWLYDAVQKAKQNMGNNEINEQTNKIIKEFVAFRIYDRPNDGWVRTGDIISLATAHDGNKDNYPGLYLVLTPACDLARFWQKTRGILTLVNMYPLMESGINRVVSFENKYQKNSSITSGHPFVLPSVFVNGYEPMDYIVFSHDIHTKVINAPALRDGMTAKERVEFYGRQLTYKDLDQNGESLARNCRIAEPFLSTLLSEIGNKLFRSGVPDFPTEEIERLTNYWKKKTT